MASFQHYHTLEKYFGSGQGSKQFFKVKSGLEAIPFCLVRARSDSFSTFPSEKMQGFAQAAREVVAEADKGRLELEKALGSKTGFKYVTDTLVIFAQKRCKHCYLTTVTFKSRPYCQGHLLRPDCGGCNRGLNAGDIL